MRRRRIVDAGTDDSREIGIARERRPEGGDNGLLTVHGAHGMPPLRIVEARRKGCSEHRGGGRTRRHHGRAQKGARRRFGSTEFQGAPIRQIERDGRPDAVRIPLDPDSGGRHGRQPGTKLRGGALGDITQGRAHIGLRHSGQSLEAGLETVEPPDGGRDAGRHAGTAISDQAAPAGSVSTRITR